MFTIVDPLTGLNIQEDIVLSIIDITKQINTGNIVTVNYKGTVYDILEIVGDTLEVVYHNDNILTPTTISYTTVMTDYS